MTLLVASDALAVALVILTLYYWRSAASGRDRLPLPPGPKRLPLFANYFDLPTEYDWLHWAKHQALYGPISSISTFGQNIIIISDFDYAIELLERRGAIYSDRPPFTFIDMCGWGNLTSLLRYGDDHTLHRKLLHQFLVDKDAWSHLQAIEEIETRHFLLRVLKQPSELLHNIRALAGAVILKFAYGYKTDHEKPDPLVELAEKALSDISLAIQPGYWLVDIISSLRYLPDWIPGTSFKQTARNMRKVSREFVERPYQFVKQQMASGAASLSFLSFLLDTNPSSADASNIKWVAASLYSGGADTTVSAIYAFFLAMVLYPEVQTKGQAEIDCVIGDTRLPALSDRHELPYIDAIVKEVLRWHVILPLGVVHSSIEDDTFRGYTIPKSSLIVCNNWLITHDPQNHEDPSRFNPERFLGVDGHKPERDPRNVIFGYGRRGCAGKDLADASIFLAIAMVLATFNITKPRNAAGIEFEPVYEQSSGAISHPKKFECTIKARSDTARELISSVEAEYEGGNHAEILSSLNVALDD